MILKTHCSVEGNRYESDQMKKNQNKTLFVTVGGFIELFSYSEEGVKYVKAWSKPEWPCSLINKQWKTTISFLLKVSGLAEFKSAIVGNHNKI